MTKMTRKDFLSLSTAMVASAGISACATQQTVAAATPASNTPDAPSGKTLVQGADVLTMNGGFEELLATDVLIEGGVITGIGKNLPANGADIVDARGMILMPGMVDGHRHVWEGIDAGRLVKTYPGKYSSTYQQWKMRTIVSMNADEFYLAGLVGGLMAIDSGVTSLLDYAHGQISQETAIASAKGLQDSGIGGWFGFQLGVSSSYKPGDTVELARAHSERIATTTEVHWATVGALQKEVFTHPDSILQLGLCPAKGIGDPIDSIRDEWDRARGTGVKIIGAHIHKPEKPFPPGYMGHRDSGMLDLYDAGLLGPDYHISHANRVTDAELAVLRETGGMICSTAMGEFPYMTSPDRGPSCHGRARAAGVHTGIGIDVTLALGQDYFEHTRAGFWNLYLEPEGVKIVSTYKSADALDFVTNLGAKAIRLGDVTGTIETGKRGDLVLVKTDRPGFGRLGTLADRIASFAAREDIDSVWVAGKLRKRNGKLVGVDMQELMEKVYAAQRRYGPLAESITFV